MSNELLKEYEGKDCHVSSGNYAVTVQGKILRVKENWLELKTKNEIMIINADFIDSIKIKQ